MELRREGWGRRKTERWRLSLLHYSVDEENKTFSALGWGFFPWPVLGLIFMSRDVLGAFSATLWASLGLAQSNILRRLLVPRFFKFLVKALPGDNVRFARVRLRHNNREPYHSPSLRWFLSFSLDFLAHGNIFWIGKGWNPKMEIFDNAMYQSYWGDKQISVVTWIP